MSNSCAFRLSKSAVATLVLTATASSVLGQVSIDTVPVGFAGNSPDTTGRGAVSYDYSIGKYEVTNAQYAAFLNAVAKTDPHGLYFASPGSESIYSGVARSGLSGSYTYASKVGYENKPVVWVSFWDAARFVNWLNNGQGNASTETGSYTLGGVSNPALGAGVRNPGQTFYIASEDEWYKAAYYDPTKGATGGYWQNATQSDVFAGSNTDFSASDGANYRFYDYDFESGTATEIYANGGFSGPGTTDVGSYFNASSFFVS
ncbi:MAG: PEP-CTERM sorting domain-containing protein [Verrucomicrobia bacterium]|nr:MAG: PEP-CTERM sorting domain-containing protein [Verrucomicrobiota bacterium]